MFFIMRELRSREPDGNWRRNFVFSVFSSSEFRECSIIEKSSLLPSRYVTWKTPSLDFI